MGGSKCIKMLRIVCDFEVSHLQINFTGNNSSKTSTSFHGTFDFDRGKAKKIGGENLHNQVL